MNAAQLRVRAVDASDLRQLAGFRCSTGEPWEELVETQVRGPMPRRYLAAPPRFDGRMLLLQSEDEPVLAVGAHHIEPTLVPDVGYTEVIAVALQARGTLVQLPAGGQISLGEFLLLTIFGQMRRLGLGVTRARLCGPTVRTSAASLCAISGAARDGVDSRHLEGAG